MSALDYLPFVVRGFRKSGPPLHLTLFVTGRCNARCRHCFHWREVEAGVAGPSLEQVEALAASTERMGPLLWVSFGGGEPFLRPDLPELARAFGRRGLRHLAIPTNGLVEDRQHASIERIVRENPKTFLSVAVSFDGPQEIHDSIRQVPGGHARSMDSVRALKRQARELGPRRLGVGILVTVTSENQHVLAEHLEQLVRELEPDNVTINLARGTAMESHLLDVDLDRYSEVVATKARLVREGALPYFDFPLARVARARDELMYDEVERVARAGDTAAPANAKGSERSLPCTAGTLSAVVFENGSVQPCEMLGREIGNLNDVDWDLARLWSGDAATELRDEIAATRCACTWECARADDVLFRKRRWPALALRTLTG